MTKILPSPILPVRAARSIVSTTCAASSSDTNYLKLDLGQKVHDVLGAAVQLGMSLLTAESLDLADRETLHTDTRQGLFDLVELERFDDRLNLLHKSPLGRFSVRPRATYAGLRLIPNNHSPKTEKVQDPRSARVATVPLFVGAYLLKKTSRA